MTTGVAGGLPPDLSEITVAPRATIQTCSADAYLTPAPVPRPQDLPRWNGQALSTYAGPCPYTVDFTDGPRRVNCPRSFVFLRRYTLTNSCTGQVDTTFEQQIYVGDHVAPNIYPPTLPPGQTEWNFPADQANCSARVNTRIGSLTIIDGCSNDHLSFIAYVFPDGNLANFPLGPYTVNGPDPADAMTDPLPLGRHLFRYVAADDCGNKSSLDLYVNVTAEAPELNILGTANGVATAANCLGGAVLRYQISGGYGGGTTQIDLDLDAPDPNPAVFELDRTVPAAFLNGNPTTSGTIASLVNLPIGNHLARITSRNDCGGETVRYTPVTINDGTAPAIRCVTDDIVELVQDPNFGGIANVRATDLLSGPSTTCSGRASDYAIYLESAAAVPNFSPRPGDQDIGFNCSDVGTQIVRVYAFSGVSGQSSYCNTILEVRAAGAQCANQNGSVFGQVRTEDGQALPNVRVTVEGGTSSLSTFTDAGGNYSLAGLTGNQNYRVRALLNTDPINGVNTFDISLLSRNLQGIDDGLSPYELLAGDANRNGAITIQDVILVREVILGINANFDNNTSWRFLDADYVFPDPADPWLEPIPENVELPILSGANRVDFLGFKVGDLDGSASPN